VFGKDFHFHWWTVLPFCDFTWGEGVKELPEIILNEGTNRVHEGSKFII
jgi:hypothetical protein